MLYIIKFKGCKSINPIYGLSESEVVANMIGSIYENGDIINLDCDAYNLDDNVADLEDGVAIMYYDEDYNIDIYKNVKDNGGQICLVDDGSGKIVLINKFINYIKCVDFYDKEYDVRNLIPLNQYGDEI